ncbi:MAG: glycosyltransferase family A protein [Bacteroidota bacterium]
MRIGSNPERDKEIPKGGYHRIIIPVYIPNLEGYFEKGMEFTRMCLESVIKTKHARSSLTVVNNGSCKEVTQYLQELYTSGGIDQLIHHAQNVGKIDAVIPIAKSASEELITISDGDVLFKDGWIQDVEDVFSTFPEAGMVSPVPHGTVYSNYTVNTVVDAFLKGALKFASVCNPGDMLKFAESIGRQDDMYRKKIRLTYQMTVNRKGFSAVVGCGHFVATLRSEVFKFAPKEPSRLAYATQADRNYIDIPNEKAGLWRLATTRNGAYHMGNLPQPWMMDEFNHIDGKILDTRTLPKSRRFFRAYGFKKFINRLLLNRMIKPYFFKWLGLKEGYKEY